MRQVPPVISWDIFSKEYLRENRPCYTGITLNSEAQFSRSPSISVLTWRAPGPLGHPGRCVRCVRVRCHWPVWVAPVVCGSGWDDPRSPGTDGHEHSDCPEEKHTQWALWLPWRETHTQWALLTALERNTHSEQSECPGEKHTQWALWLPWRETYTVSTLTALERNTHTQWALLTALERNTHSEQSECPGEKHTQWALWLPWRETYTVSTLTALERNTHSEHSWLPWRETHIVNNLSALERNTHSEHSDCPGEKHTQWALWLPWRETHTHSEHSWLPWRETQIVNNLSALKRNTHSEHSDCPGEKHTQWAHWLPWRETYTVSTLTALERNTQECLISFQYLKKPS